MEVIHKEIKYAKKEVRKLSRVLLNSHIPHNPDLLTKYRIRKTDVIKGVHCPKCFHLPLYRDWGKWYCSACNDYCQDAHINALEDYSLLIGDKISNREIREYLNVSSAQVVYHLVKDLGFISTGTFRNRTYILPPPE